LLKEYKTKNIQGSQVFILYSLHFQLKAVGLMETRMLEEK